MGKSAVAAEVMADVDGGDALAESAEPVAGSLQVRPRREQPLVLQLLAQLGVELAVVMREHVAWRAVAGAIAATRAGRGTRGGVPRRRAARHTSAARASGVTAAAATLRPRRCAGEPQDHHQRKYRYDGSLYHVFILPNVFFSL